VNEKKAHKQKSPPLIKTSFEFLRCRTLAEFAHANAQIIGGRLNYRIINWKVLYLRNGIMYSATFFKHGQNSKI